MTAGASAGQQQSAPAQQPSQQVYEKPAARPLTGIGSAIEQRSTSAGTITLPEQIGKSEGLKESSFGTGTHVNPGYVSPEARAAESRAGVTPAQQPPSASFEYARSAPGTQMPSVPIEKIATTKSDAEILKNMGFDTSGLTASYDPSSGRLTTFTYPERTEPTFNLYDRASEINRQLGLGVITPGGGKPIDVSGFPVIAVKPARPYIEPTKYTTQPLMDITKDISRVGEEYADKLFNPTGSMFTPLGSAKESARITTKAITSLPEFVATIPYGYEMIARDIYGGKGKEVPGKIITGAGLMALGLGTSIKEKPVETLGTLAIQGALLGKIPIPKEIKIPEIPTKGLGAFELKYTQPKVKTITPIKTSITGIEMRGYPKVLKDIQADENMARFKAEAKEAGLSLSPKESMQLLQTQIKIAREKGITATKKPTSTRMERGKELKAQWEQRARELQKEAERSRQASGQILIQKQVQKLKPIQTQEQIVKQLQKQEETNVFKLAPNRYILSALAVGTRLTPKTAYERIQAQYITPATTEMIRTGQRELSREMTRTVSKDITKEMTKSASALAQPQAFKSVSMERTAEAQAERQLERQLERQIEMPKERLKLFPGFDQYPLKGRKKGKKRRYSRFLKLYSIGPASNVLKGLGMQSPKRKIKSKSTHRKKRRT